MFIQAVKTCEKFCHLGSPDQIKSLIIIVGVHRPPVTKETYSDQLTFACSTLPVVAEPEQSRQDCPAASEFVSALHNTNIHTQRMAIVALLPVGHGLNVHTT
jgi:hypothetical protein